MIEKKTIVAFLVFCNVVAFVIFHGLRSEENFKVIFFDVGQGDAALIRTSERQTILIDGGPGDKIISHLADEIPFWDKKIDLIILTHAHADHLSGLIEVIKRYEVKKVLWNKQAADTLIYKKWESLIDDIPSRRAFRGQKIYFADGRLDVLFPSREHSFSEDLNENSVIKRLIHSSGKILFTGDAYREQEEKLLQWKEDCREDDFYWCEVMSLDAEVLKVGHHGSSTSSSPYFLKKVDPEIAVISAGENNRYGHPHQETIDNLSDLRIGIYKTFRDGSLIVDFD